MIDSIIMMVLIFPYIFLTGGLDQALSGQQMTKGQEVTLFSIGWIIYLILNGYLLYKKGQTIGKVIVKTRIVDFEDKVPNFGRLLIFRYFILGIVAHIPILGNIFVLVNVLFIFGKERRCIHDYMAGTLVIDA